MNALKWWLFLLPQQMRENNEPSSTCHSHHRGFIWEVLQRRRAMPSDAERRCAILKFGVPATLGAWSPHRGFIRYIGETARETFV